MHAPPRAATTIQPLRINLESAGGTMLTLLAFTGAFVLVEPSPFEATFLLTLIMFAMIGMRLRAGVVPLILVVAIWLIGGFFALLPVVTKGRSLQYFIISAYLGVMAVVIATIIADNTVARLDRLRKGYIAGASLAAFAGLLGFFDIAGLGDTFTLNSRARGTFKDPNVFGPFLVLPAIYLIQDLLLGKTRRMLLTLSLLAILVLGVFLSFSRGAWAVFIGSVAMLFALTFITENDTRARLRIVTAAAGALVFAAAMLAVILSIDEVRALFEIRFSLRQDYDLGETGRFGSQLRSIPLLLDRPNGLGPLQFREYFPEDPHNVYIAAFAYYGWAGGIGYIAIVLLTLFAGWRIVLQRTAWQQHTIAIWSTLFLQILQGFQIDTDHWRHFFLMLGAIWGLAIASQVAARKARLV